LECDASSHRFRELGENTAATHHDFWDTRLTFEKPRKHSGLNYVYQKAMKHGWVPLRVNIRGVPHLGLKATTDQRLRNPFIPSRSIESKCRTTSDPAVIMHQGTGKSDAWTRAHSQSCAKQNRQDQVALQITSHRIADHSIITASAGEWDVAVALV
jgi:hypothetical protein